MKDPQNTLVAIDKNDALFIQLILELYVQENGRLERYEDAVKQANRLACKFEHAAAKL